MNPELLEALKKDDKKKIKELINLPGESGLPPLIEYLGYEEKPDLDTLRLLLENGADVNARLDGGLLITVLISRNLLTQDILKLILEKGNLNPFLSSQDTVFTAKTRAWFDKHYEVMDLLKKYELQYRERQSKQDPEGLKKDIEHLRLIHFIKQKGHSLGIDGEITMSSPDVPGGRESVRTRSYFTPFTIDHLLNLLTEYQARLSQAPERSTTTKQFTEISEAFQSLLKTLNIDEKIDCLVDRIKNHASLPTILSVNAKDHALSVAIFGDYVIISNRGGRDERRLGFGSRIYKLTEETRKILTPEYIESLSDNSATEDVINARLKPLIPRENFVEEIESQEQKHGTCSFANHKSIIRPILYIIERKRLALVHGLPENDKKIMAEAAANAKRAYKEFTLWMRNREINDMIEQYKNGIIPKDVYEQLTIAYIEQHINTWRSTKDPEKRGLEVERAYSLLRDLPQDFITKIIGSLKDNGTDFIAKAEQFGKRDIANFIRRNRPEYIVFLEAMQKGESEKLLAMLDKGLDPNHMCDDNTSTLFLEALKKDLPKSVIDAMLLHGASVNQKLEGGFSALCRECNKEQANLSWVKKLIEMGADIDYVVPEDGLSPLFYAMQHNQTNIVAYLLEKGADTKIINNKGQTALTFSASGEPEIVELLLKNGADPNEMNANHETPLIVFVKNSDMADTAEILINHGARVDIRDKDGKTALDIVKAPTHSVLAQQGDYTEIIALLEATEKNEKEKAAAFLFSKPKLVKDSAERKAEIEPAPGTQKNL